MPQLGLTRGSISNMLKIIARLLFFDKINLMVNRPHKNIIPKGMHTSECINTCA
jgi:hypothetical protein